MIPNLSRACPVNGIQRAPSVHRPDTRSDPTNEGEGDATTLDDVRSVKGHHLEALVGDRAGQYSIKINDQYRVCFEWPDDSTGAIEIEVADYH